jgi:hypothetical protein
MRQRGSQVREKTAKDTQPPCTATPSAAVIARPVDRELRRRSLRLTSRLGERDEVEQQFLDRSALETERLSQGDVAQRA